MNHTKVFVYGTLQKNGGRNDIMVAACAEFLGKCYTTNKYIKKEHPHGYPYLLDKKPTLEETKKTFNIIGELYDVPDGFMEVIDNYEGYPELFYRDIINVNIEDTIIEAYCYFLKE